MKKTTLTCCAFLTMFPPLYSKASDHIDCSVEFELNSSSVFLEQDSLDNCLKNLEGKEIEAVTILGSASPEGSLKRNRLLAHERATLIARIVKAKYPNIPVKGVGIGVNKEAGKKSQITFTVKSEEDIQKKAFLEKKLNELEAQVQEKDAQLNLKENQLTLKDKQMDLQKENLLNERDIAQERDEDAKKEEDDSKSFFGEDPNFRAAVSLGVDSTTQNVRRNYVSVGGEVSWINRTSSFRPEVGVKGTTSNGSRTSLDGKSPPNVTNAYGFIGAGATAKGFVLGVRLLGGREWIDIDDQTPVQNQFALGGEGRIGYEWKKGFSTFASYGLTNHLQMIGVDLGVSF